MQVPENRLCVLCCFFSSSIDKHDRVANCLSDDSNLKEFLSHLDQLNNNYNDSSKEKEVLDKTRLFKLIGYCGDKVTLCEQCSKLISKAVEVRKEVGVVEEKVIWMQRELLEELRRMKNLMTSYYGRMRTIETTVRRRSDVECVEDLMEGIMGWRLKRRPDVDFMLFRDKISQVVEDLGAYRRDLEERHGLEEELSEPESPAGLEVTFEEDVPDIKVEVTTADFRSAANDLDNSSTVAVVNDNVISRDYHVPAQFENWDPGEAVSAIKVERSARFNAVIQVGSSEVRESEEDSSSEDDARADVTSDSEPDFHSDDSTDQEDSWAASKRRRRMVIESSSEEDDDNLKDVDNDPEREPSALSSESDFEPPSPSPPPVTNPRRKRGRPSKNRDSEPTSPNIAPVDFSGMSYMKKAVVKSILRRKRVNFRKYSSDPEAAFTNPLDIPVKIRVPFEYNDTNKNITVGGLEVIVHQGHLKCTVCDFLSPSWLSKSLNFVMDKIYNHVADKHLNAFQCHLCPRRVHQRKKFRDHLTIHKKAEACICDICGKPLKDPYSVANHKWTHLSPEEQSRAVKSGKAPAVIKLRVKAKKKAEEKAYQCDTCGKRFGSMQYLQKHETRIHSNDDIIICPKCGKECKRQSYHTYHKKYVCPLGEEEERRRLSCMECDKTFISGKGLKRHVARMHSENAVERPFICDLCGKGFKAVRDVKYHRGTHSEERPWKCDKCGKDFNMKRNLARHKCRQAKSH